jgi:hypothetical protein
MRNNRRIFEQGQTASQAFERSSGTDDRNKKVSVRKSTLGLAGAALAFGGWLFGMNTQGEGDKTEAKINKQGALIQIANQKLGENGLRPTRDQTFVRVSSETNKLATMITSVDCANFRAEAREDASSGLPGGRYRVCITETTTRRPVIEALPANAPITCNTLKCSPKL